MPSRSWYKMYLTCRATTSCVVERYACLRLPPTYCSQARWQTTLRPLENPFSQRVNAIVQKIRELRRGVYYPHLYIVKEDGEPPLRFWALSMLIQDRADMLPSYQQFISSLKDKVNVT